MTVEERLRELLQERAVPPAAPPGRADAVLRAAGVRRRRQVLAGAATALVLTAAVTVPLGLSTQDMVPAAVAAPLYPPGAEPVLVDDVAAAGSEITLTRLVGHCGGGRTAAAARLEDGRWHLAVWVAARPAAAPPAAAGLDTPPPTVVPQAGTGRPCVAMARQETLRVPLPEPYAGQPVVDAASGRELSVNGGPGFPVPDYLPPGYGFVPGVESGLTLAGPQGDIEITVGGRDIGVVRNRAGWPYDVLDRPDINGTTGVLVRYRDDGGNTLLHWVAGDRGIRLQVTSARLDPAELVRVARSMS